MRKGFHADSLLLKFKINGPLDFRPNFISFKKNKNGKNAACGLST